MYKLRLVGLLLRPSLFSSIVTLVLTGVILGVANWSSVTNSPLFYDYLNLATVLQSAPDSVTAFTDALFARPLTYNVLIFLISLAAGILVYSLLEALNRGIVSFMSTRLDLKVAQQPNKMAVEIEVGFRLGFRIFIGILWFFYWLFSLKILFPFCILAFHSGVNEFAMGTGWKYSLLGFLLLFAGLHVHVIFMRLLALRPRVFGERDALLQELYGK